jgi:hypothetical protein
MNRTFIITLATTTLLSPPVLAQMPAIDAAGAETVKTMVQGYINRQVETMASHGIKIEQKGDLTVEPKGTYYTATLPYVTYIVTDETVENENRQGRGLAKIDYGVTRMNIMPTAKPNQWKMAVSLPSPIRLVGETHATDKASKETKSTDMTLDVHLKTERFAMLWDDSQKFPVAWDAVIKDVRVGESGKPETPLTIGEIRTNAAYTESAPGIVSGPTNFKMTNMAVDVTGANCPEPCKNPFKMSLGELALNSNVDTFDIAKNAAFEKKMAELSDAGLDETKNPSPQAIDALWKALVVDGMGIANGFDANFTIQNVMIENTENGKTTQHNIEKLAFEMGAGNLKSDKSNGYLGWSATGDLFKDALLVKPFFHGMDAVPDFAKSYIPNGFNFKFTYTNLPHMAILEQAGKMAQAGANDPAGGKKNLQMMGMQAMMTLPQILSAAGTTATLDTDMLGDKLSMVVNGNVKADAAALYSATGTLKAVIAGLDALVTDAQAAAAAEKDPKKSEKISGMIGGLTGLQMFGQQGTDANGKPARTYDFAVDAAGKVTLNGADFSGMVGGPPPSPIASPDTLPPASPAQ